MMFRTGLVLCALSAVVSGAKFPANQQKCQYGDSDCLVKIANEIMSRGKQGYPELGLPIFDPLRIEKLNIDQGGNGPVNLKMLLRNIDLHGLSELTFTKIDGFRRDYDKAKMELRFKYPVMQIQGPYKLDGKVLVLPVQGNGVANLTFYDNDLTLKLLTRKVVKQGKNYMQIEKSKLNFETPRIYVHFGNLFNGNKQLGDTTNSFFNENWKEILKEIKPAVADAIASVYSSLMNNIFTSIPYEDMFLE